MFKLNVIAEKAPLLPASLKSSMFLDRTRQFQERLGWDVNVSDNGEERDQYDVDSSNYIIVYKGQNSHLGSMRLIPIEERNMLFEIFPQLIPNDFRPAKNTVECTRFCVAQKLSGNEAKSVVFLLMRSALEFGIREGFDYALGIFDRRMNRIYRQIGWKPVVLGEAYTPHGEIYLGQWIVSESAYDIVNKKYLAHLRTEKRTTCQATVSEWESQNGPIENPHLERGAVFQSDV